MLHMFAGFETAKIPDETAKKNPTKRRKKSRAQNAETEIAKKNWKQRKFRQAAIIIAASDFER